MDPLLNLKYNYVRRFGENLAAVEKDGKWGVIDNSDKTVVDFKYDNFLTYGSINIVIIDNKYGLVDLECNEITPIIFDDYESWNEISVELSKDNRWGSFNIESRIFIPCEYEAVHGISENVAAVKIKGKWSFINYKRELLVPEKFNDVMKLSDKFAGIKSGRKWGIIDIKGNIIFNCQFDELIPYPEMGNIVVMRKKKKYGFLDLIKQKKYPAVFAIVMNTDKKLYPVIKSKRYGIFNPHSFRVGVPCIYDFAYPLSENLVEVTLAGKLETISLEN